MRAVHLILVIPCYNEERRLPIDELRAFALPGHRIELFLVNDGSRDGTLGLLESLRREDPERFSVLNLERNSGKAEAVRRGILAETGRLTVVGIVLGLPLSWMAARAIRGLLYDVGAFDVVTFGATLLALVVVAACGGYIPARRATRVDPALALRPR